MVYQFKKLAQNISTVLQSGNIIVHFFNRISNAASHIALGYPN